MDELRTRRATADTGPVDSSLYTDSGRSRFSRVSWGAVLAGTAVAMAIQLLINQIQVWAGFGLGEVTTPGALADHTTSAGLWIALSAFIGVFIGSIVASWAAGSWHTLNGVWHGLSVMGTTVVLSLVLSTAGIAPILGFGITPHSIVSYFGLTGTAGPGITSLIDQMSGWFLVQVFATMVAGVGGGILGARGRVAAVETATTTEEYRDRRAA